MENGGFYQSALFWEKAFGQMTQALGGPEWPPGISAFGGLFPFMQFPRPDPLPFDPQLFEACFKNWSAFLKDHPAFAQEALDALTTPLFALFQNTQEAMINPDIPPIIHPEKGDFRFTGDAWKAPPFRFISQVYLLVSRWLMTCLARADLDEASKKQLSFWAKQWTDMLAPSNFPLTNPDVWKKTADTGGGNLGRGWKNLMHDWSKGPQEAFLALTKPEGFAVGGNLAITPGEVIFQNDLLQLIHYRPLKEKVFATPLLIVPPWINKFYLFDLRPENSFVRWALEQGQNVFMISWVNPEGAAVYKTFDDYILQGFIPALEAVLQITESPRAHMMGLCLGGNLLACGLAYLQASGRNLAQTTTFLATLLDFHQVTGLEVFIHPEHLQCLETSIKRQGYMDGHLLALTFSALRPNEMIWGPLVRRYFLGEDAPPLDFLFWNADPQRIPGPLHLFLLENFFQKNLFNQPGGVHVGGVSCDLHKLTAPRFILASLKDHIAPWKGCFPTFFHPDDQFVLSTSGHIAGVINPPSPQKYSYWTSSETTEGPEAWLQKAQETKGSWWTFWKMWVESFASEQIPAPSVGSSNFPPREAAPGSYVQKG